MIVQCAEQRDILNRCLQDLVDQTYVLLANRGVARQLIRAAWIEWWLTQGKTPVEVVNIALGLRPDAHLGGVDA